MQTRKSLFTNPLILVALGCVMAVAVACGDDDSGGNPAPSGGSKAMGGSAGSGGKTSGGGKGGTAGKPSTAGTGNEPAMGGAGGVEEPGTGGAGGAPDCTDETDNGCFSCKPKTLADFLNACPTTGCEKFDNTALTSAPDGVLPDLP